MVHSAVYIKGGRQTRLGSLFFSCVINEFVVVVSAFVHF